MPPAPCLLAQFVPRHPSAHHSHPKAVVRALGLYAGAPSRPYVIKDLPDLRALGSECAGRLGSTNGRYGATKSQLPTADLGLTEPSSLIRNRYSKSNDGYEAERISALPR